MRIDHPWQIIGIGDGEDRTSTAVDQRLPQMVAILVGRGGEIGLKLGFFF